MSTALHATSLRSKLMRAVWLTSGLAFLLSALAMLAYEQVTYQPRLARELNAKADLLSLNLHAALNFNDVQAAGENLAAMKNMPEVVLACVLRPDGAVFASYRGRSARLQCQPQVAPAAASLQFRQQQMWMTRPILYQQDTVGYLQIGYAVPSLQNRPPQYAAALAMVSATLLLLAMILSRLLRRLVTDPVLDLAQLAGRVIDDGNYQLRAVPRSGDELGRLAGTLNRLLDTVQQREVELQQSQRLLQAVIDNTTSAIYIKDLQGRFLLVNQCCLRVIGKSQAEVLGRSVFDLYPAHFAGQYHQNDMQVINSNSPLESEETAPLADGVHTYLSLKFPLRDELGQPYAMCGISTDITERKLAQRQLEQSRDDLEAAVARRTAELENANKELQAFSYSVSHDLRAPLRAIDGFSSMLAEDYSAVLDATGNDMLQRMRKAAVRMGELIDDMLNLSRVGSAGMNAQPTCLSEMADAILQELQALSPQRQCRIRVAPDLMATVDPQLFQIALRNLLENAWKYSARQDVAEVEFGACERDGQTVYFVRDNGAGFDMQYAGRLFQPFQRLHAKEEFEGTGVGLATVSCVLQRHGGRIWAEAAPGAGATFYFSLGASAL